MGVSKSQKSENELAKTITAWLIADEWEVFEEISPWGSNSSRADLVAKRGAVIWVIETKRNFSLELLDQATGWLPYAHFVSVGIWYPKRTLGIMSRVCRNLGLGLISVRDESSGFSERFQVNEQEESRFNRRAATEKIRSMLIEETRAKGEAGCGGKVFETPFKNTCRKLLRAVEESPGITLAAALRAATHHYADDRKAHINILNRLEQNVIPEIVWEKRGKDYLLYPLHAKPVPDKPPPKLNVQPFNQVSLFGSE